MSEIISYEATSVLEDQTSASGNFDGESNDDNWDRELFALVAENANVLIRCPWMNDMEVSLTVAMDGYPEPITSENVHIVISVALELLANRVTETEEPAEEDKPEEEEPAKTEEADQESNPEAEVQKVQENSNKVDAGVVVNLVQSESKQSTQGTAKAEAATSSSNNLSEISGGRFTPVVPSAEAQLDDTKVAIKSEVKAKQQIPAFETPEDTVANTIVEAEPALYRPQIATDHENKSVTLPVAIEATAEPELTELSALDLASEAVPGNTINKLSDEEIGVAEYESTLVTFEPEEEILLDHLEEVDLESGELDMFSIPPWEGTTDKPDESSLLGQMENTSPDQLVQISLSIEEIEDSLIQLTERIEASEPETTEEVNEILDKIIEVPAKLKARSGENIITEAEAQEELEVLFTELLDRTGIDYSPELIESLARLTLKWHLADEIQKLKNEEETDKTLIGIGTHEIIKKLLAGLSIIKKTMIHAYAIGKSALQLYNFSFAKLAETA